jgi:predicted HTH domain antitoxin
METEFLDVNLNKLEEENQAQPRRIYEYGMKLAQAKREVKRLKAKLKVTDAEIAREARKLPEKYGMFKVTDETVKEAVLSSNLHKIMEQQLIDAEYEEEILKVAVDALVDKRDSMSDLAKLHGQLYWCKTSSNEETRKAVMSSVSVSD